MNRRDFIASTAGCAAVLAIPSRIAAQEKAIEPDLAALADANTLTAPNRTVTHLADGAKSD